MGLGLYPLKIPVNLSQYRGIVGLFNTKNIANRSKVNKVQSLLLRIDPKSTKSKVSLISVMKIFLSLSLFSVLFYLKDGVSKIKRQLLVSILISSTILLILFAFFFSLLVCLSCEVEVSPGPNRKPN